MRLIGVWMVSVYPDHDFAGLNPLQLGLRWDYFTIVNWYQYLTTYDTYLSSFVGAKHDQFR